MKPVRAEFWCEICAGMHKWKYYDEYIVCEYCGERIAELATADAKLAGPNVFLWCNLCHGYMDCTTKGRHVVCNHCGEYKLTFDLYRISEKETVTPEIVTAAALMAVSPEAVVEWNVKHYG